MIPDSFKADLLNRVDIVEVVGRYVPLKKAGANLSGLCPFHNEKTPSFTVSPAKQFYHCFGCQKHGNAIGFLMDYGGMGYVDALKDLASMVGMQVPEWQPRTPEEAKKQARETDLAALMQKAMDFYRAELKRAPRAIDYLKRRGLSGETAARFGVGYAPDDWQGLKRAFPDYESTALVECGLVIEGEGKRYDRFRDRIMFPIFNRRDSVVGFGGRVLGEGEPKYLNSPETPLFQKGLEIYGLGHAREAIREAKRALVVEGYMDVLALAQHGVGYAVATLGTATSPVHVTRLLRELRESGCELVFCFDGDSAGRKAAWRALEVSLPLATDTTAIRFLFLPDGEDPDSFVRAQGKDAFERLIARAQTLSGFLLGELRAQSDLAAPEGRARFQVTAKPLIQRLAAPALRQQLVRAVAELAQIAPDYADGYFAPEGEARPRRAAPGKAQAPILKSEEQHLLRCVVTNPALAEELDEALLDPDLPESAALRSLAADLAGTGGASGAVLVDRYQGTPFEKAVFQAQESAIDQGVTPESAALEFRQLQIALHIRRKHREIEVLKGQVEVNPALNAELHQRVKELHQLKSQRS
ncbi:MAG: DNA primase [Betaproteobacteria bacterium]|nr:DNA primase [Betaproteobacteria bacterium]MDH5577325.1 DNA primase [Betaproteobacteria bacterium]